MKSIRIPDLGLWAVSCLLLIPILQSGSCLAIQDDWKDQTRELLTQLELLRIAGNFDIKFGMLKSPLRSENVNCRETAIQMLGIVLCDAERVVPALIAALDDERAIVRMRVAGALGKYGAKAIAALPRLKESLNDDYYAVRTASEAVLGLIEPSPWK